MNIIEIITNKRDGKALSKEEINFFIDGLVNGSIPDYQASAFLMATFLKGMTAQETADLSHAMMQSGDIIDLSSIAGIKVDKHSTGGVGDKTSLILGPLVASAGVPVAKMSGRGLGHTGGTIDKLEAISGFSVEIPIKDFIGNVNEIGVAICGQSGNLVPADKKLYALRDVTATVRSMPLIASSIMSKKLASGADAIVLDVKTGDGAFMRTTEEAFQLANAMVDIGKVMGRKTIALVTDMEEPLGKAVGNSLEVIEAIATLKGEGPKDLLDLCLELGAQMLVAGAVSETTEEAKAILEEKLASGAAFEKFKQFISFQNGDVSQIEDISLLPQAAFSKTVASPESGYITKLQALSVGVASMMLGAGRKNKESKIDLAAGIYLNVKVGDYIKKGESLATLYTNDESKISEAAIKLLSAYNFSEKEEEKRPLIFGVVGS